MSIFDLTTNAEDLSKSVMGKSDYVKLAPTRDVVGDNFSNGTISFKWELGASKWWHPQSSFVRMRCSITNPAGEQFDMNDEIAGNMNLCAALFQNAEFLVNDKVVSRIGDYMAQIDALYNRSNKSSSWLKSLGFSLNNMEGDFRKRQADICVDGEYKQENVAVKGEVALVVGTNQITISTVGGLKLFTYTANGGTAIPDLTQKIQPGDEVILENDKRIVVIGVTADSLSAYSTIPDTGAAANVTSNIGYKRDVSKNYSRKAKEFELIWQPPLAILGVDHALPLGKYELRLNPAPKQAYQLHAIQSISQDKTTANFKFDVKDMYFYCNQMEGPRVSNKNYLIDLDAISCQSDKVDNLGLSQKTFSVSPSTHKLTVAYQDTRVNNNTIYSQSQFRVDSEEKAYERQLQRFFVQYAGEQKPSPDYELSYDEAKGINNLTELYAQTQITNGGMYDNGGSETQEQFENNGLYISQNWNKDASDRSTRVVVNQSFNNANPLIKDNMNVLLFSHHKQVAIINIEEERVTSVALQDA